MNRRFLRDFIEEYPFQPATAFWRAIEVEHMLIEPLPEGRGLDLGCGDGRLMRLITHYAGARELVGVDIDPLELELAKTLGLYESLHESSSSSLPFDDSSFDFVISNSVLEHIEPIEQTLAEVGRILRPGGVFLFSVPSHDFHACIWAPQPFRAEYLRDLDERLVHLRYWDVETWTDALLAQGMRVIHHSTYLSQSEVRRWQLLTESTAGVLYRLNGRQLKPIQLQRGMGLRGASRRTPSWLSRILSKGMMMGVADTSPRFGGLFLKARQS